MNLIHVNTDHCDGLKIENHLVAYRILYSILVLIIKLIKCKDGIFYAFLLYFFHKKMDNAYSFGIYKFLLCKTATFLKTCMIDLALYFPT